jgi:hypothetical protein
MGIAADHGLFDAIQALQETFNSIGRELFSKYRVFPDLTPDSPAWATLSASFAKLTTDQSMAAVEAARFVFAHTILDGLATSIVGFLAAAEPERWEDTVKDRKVSLAEAKADSYEKLRGNLLDKQVKELAQDSLIKRFGIIFSRTGENNDLIRDFGYDQKRMEQLDQLRHDFVHKDALGNRMPTLDDDLNFMYKSGMALIAAVSQHLGIRVNLSRVVLGARESTV